MIILDFRYDGIAPGVQQLTQLFALRVEKDYRVTSQLGLFPRSSDGDGVDRRGAPYSGYESGIYLNVSEGDAVKAFYEWYNSGETVYYWYYSMQQKLSRLIKTYIGPKATIKSFCIHRKITERAAEENILGISLSDIASNAGLPAEITQNVSERDAYTLKSLLEYLSISEDDLTADESFSRESYITRRKNNEAILQRMPFRYVFTPGSEVFHDSSCKLLLNASDIYGCTKYDTAIKRSRPCKVCHPEPEDIPNQSDALLEETADLDRLVWANVVGEGRIQLAQRHIVGCCHSRLHPGKLTSAIMKNHDCLGKNCSCFQKYEDSPYWENYERAKAAKREANLRKTERRQREAKKMEQRESLRLKLQKYADLSDHPMNIIRVEEENNITFKVFYVSDNPFADARCYSDFLETLSDVFPENKVILRHIRDEYGNYVTNAEYVARKRMR